jgi:signal transduction histidine kinase/CheY-like chemotaxis protein
MKRLYILFLLAGLICLSLSTASIWWFLGVGITLMAFLAYRYFESRLRSTEVSNTALEQEVEDLQLQLDKTIRKEQRSSREASEYKHVREGLLSALSHEIRTPLNGIMGMASLLTETSLTREQLEYTETIRRSGESLLITVNKILAGSLLNLSKSGQQEELPPECKEFDLRDCIEEMLLLFVPQITRTGVQLLYDIGLDVPEQIKGDRKRLGQVLTNLVENAVRCTAKGEITISVCLFRKTEGDELELGFEVMDTGAGIPAGRMEDLFKGLSAPETAEGKADRPAGLGLVICKRLVETMQGFIEASSVPGHGSTFTFSIRVTRSQQQSRMFARQQRTAFEGKHVLVVDDNTVRRVFMMRRLEKLNFIPVAADSARQALEILSRHQALDLLIADNGLAGNEVAQLIAAAKSRTPAIPAVVLRGPADPGDTTEAVPFDAALTRPVRQHQLSDQLLQLLTMTKDNSAGAGDGAHQGPRLEHSFAQDHPLRILLAEDHPVNQKLAMTVLGKLGYQPDLAGNGKEALDMLSHKTYDMILMDVQMPEVDGLEATRMIRLCVQPQPVILAMTANVMQGDRDNCIQAGMDDYISKPLELDELIAQLKKWSAVIREKIK